MCAGERPGRWLFQLNKVYARALEEVEHAEMERLQSENAKLKEQVRGS